MIITGQYIWNDFFWPNLFINSPRRMTAPLALVSVQAQQGGGPMGPCSPAFRSFASPY